MTRYSVQFGYYSGIFAGVFVDGISSYYLFFMAASLSGLSLFTLALISVVEWCRSVAVLVCLYLIMAGFSAALATLGAMTHMIKNFS